jgi:hypothetical protein
MTIPELIVSTRGEIELLNHIAGGLIIDLEQYPKGGYDLSKLSRLEHIHNTLLALNGVLTEPVY